MGKKMTAEYPKNEDGVIKSGSISKEELQVKYPMPVKPVTVRLKDFKKNLNKVVAESELPPFLLEMALGEMLFGISGVAEKEYAQDRAEWEKACKEGEEDG